MLFAVDVDDGDRVVYFPEETPESEHESWRRYTASSLHCIVPRCRAPLEAHFRSTKRDGFRHHSGTGEHRPITLWHEQGAQHIAQWAKAQHAAFEVALEKGSADRKRRPDVTVTGRAGEVAFEVQYASHGVDDWKQRHADLQEQYLAQTWLLGHRGEHFKLTPDGRLKFSALVHAMVEVGCIPVWINAETGQVLTAWSEPDEFGPTPPSGAAAYRHKIVSLAECKLTAEGLRTPALDALKEAAERRADAVRRRAQMLHDARERRQALWDESDLRRWVLDRHEGDVPAFITETLRDEKHLAVKVDLIPAHWKALVYHRIITDPGDDLIVYSALLSALARGELRNPDKPFHRALNDFLFSLQRANQISVLAPNGWRVLGVRRRDSFDSMSVKAATADTQRATEPNPEPVAPTLRSSDEMEGSERPTRSAVIQEAVLSEAIAVTRDFQRRSWRLRRPWKRSW